jgi:hypothetical protein
MSRLRKHRVARWAPLLAAALGAGAAPGNASTPNASARVPAAEFIARIQGTERLEDLERMALHVVLDDSEARLYSDEHLGQLQWAGVAVWRRKAECGASLERAKGPFEAKFGRHGTPRELPAGGATSRQCLEWKKAASTILLCCTQYSGADGGLEWMNLSALKSFGSDAPVDISHGLH